MSASRYLGPKIISLLLNAMWHLTQFELKINAAIVSKGTRIGLEGYELAESKPRGQLANNMIWENLLK